MSLELFSLQDRVAIVTGAGRGLGRSIALGYAAAGADLVLAARSTDLIESAAREVEALGRRALAVTTDVSQADQVAHLVQRTLDSFGTVDILVNNAAISPVYKRAEAIEEAEWDAIMAVDLKGVFLCIKAVAPTMIANRHGKVINVGSVAGLVGSERLMAYGAAKGGLHQLTRTLAVEWARHNIQVNALAPGWIATGFTAGLRANEHFFQRLTSTIPQGRFAEPDEFIGAAIFLASRASDYVTGVTLAVDGGISAW